MAISKEIKRKVELGGYASLTEQELFEVLGLKTKTAPATDAVASPDSLYATFTALNPAQAFIVGAAEEIGRRRYASSSGKVTGPKDAMSYLTLYKSKNQEHFVTITLSGSHHVIEVRCISVGILNKTIVHPREVFADAIMDRAAAMIVAHNHPSGQLAPSEEDRNITKRLREVGELVGIPVLDHLIIAKEGYFSFQEAGI